MKTLTIIFIASVTTISAWAQQTEDRQQSPQRPTEAVGNSRLNTDFSKYKTFTWAKSDPTAVGSDGYEIYYYEMEPVNKPQKKAKNKSAKTTSEPYIYSYSVIIPAHDDNANSVIQDAISHELEGRGYRDGGGSGDLIVAYQVLDRKATLHGYTNNDPATVTGGQEIRQASDTTTFILEPGTLLITLVDANTSQMVWDGFSANMNENDAFITDEVKLKEAVHEIFEQFKYTADKARKD